MNDTAKLLKEMGPIKIAAMVIVGIMILSSFVYLASDLSKPAVVPLFTGLDSSDSSKIAAKLETMAIYYEMKSGGSEILVPRDKVLSVRMGMAEDGLPSGRANIGYEIFDRSDTLGVSSFVNNVNLLRALEGELGRTISAFEQIDSARVHLVLPKQDIFSKGKRNPSASVVLKMRGGDPLGRSQISAISHLVSTAVPGLSVSDITIVDTRGRPFKKGSENPDDPGVMASTNEEFRVQYQMRMKNTIETMISRTVGVGKVEAQVTADIDFNREVAESEIYDPDGQVARSVQTTEEKGKTVEPGVGGDVSAANNLPGGEAGQNVNAAGSSSERLNEITNYEVSKTTRKEIKETGTVQRLSIAVLIDGNYSYDEETGEAIYTPQSEEVVKNIEKLVKSAVGYDESRGDTIEVINMRFSTEIMGFEKPKPFEWLTRDLGNIVQTLVIGIVIVLVMLLIVKPMVGRAFEITKNEDEEAELQAALANQDLAELAEITGQEEKAKKRESLIDIDRFEERMNATSVGAINDIVDRHTEEAVTILRSWLEEDNK